MLALATGISEQSCLDHLQAVEEEQIVATMMQDPPRSGLSTWCCLVAEIRLAAGELDEAAPSPI